jgi:hypothetical protein
MDSTQLNALKQRHAYETWREFNTLQENLFIWKFFLSGNEFPGWRMHRTQVVEPEESQPYIKSTWQRSQGDKEELINVDIFERESRLAAHEFLLQLLGEFMSPLIKRREDLEIGDVAFAVPEDTMIIFARANLAISMGNAGSDLVLISKIARQFDQKLIALPERAGLRVISEILPPDFIVLPDQVSAPLAIEPFSSLSSNRWHKLFSHPGEIQKESGQLIYRSISSEPHEVKVFSINPSSFADY